MFKYRFLFSATIIILLTLVSLPGLAKRVPDSFADMVEKLSPSVVNISTTQTVEAAENPFGNLQLPPGSPFQDLPELFKRFYGDPGQGNGNGDNTQKHKAASAGSGFVIDSDGYIVTNNHVIENADEIWVTFSDDTKLAAKVLGHDPKTDVALLKVDAENTLPAVTWGDSDAARVGDWVIAIGNPFGLGGSVSAGIISARARDINAGPFDDFIQTDAAINRGNSGGPLFNVDGKVIGINTAIFSPTGGNVGIGFAIPSAITNNIIRQLKEHGRTFRGWLGVKIQTVTEEIAESIGLEEAVGALVLDVTADSPADKAGLKAGDVILTFDGRDVPVMRKLPRIVADTKVNKKVAVEVWRNNKKRTHVVTVAELDETQQQQASNSLSDNNKQDALKEGSTEILGLTVKPLNPVLRKRFNVEDKIKHGIVVIDVDKDGPAGERGFRTGDVIVTANQVTLISVDQFEDEIKMLKNSGRKSILLLVERRGETQFVTLPFKKKK